jgi:hypothetical protein
MAAVALIGTIVSAMGSVMTSMNQSANEDSQADANRYNATIQRQNAQVASEQANAKEEVQRRKTNAIQGTQRAAMAQSGLGLSESMRDVYDESAMNAHLDALNTRYEGYMMNRGLTAQAGMSDYQASIHDSNSARAMSSAWMGVASSLLSGAGGYMSGGTRAGSGAGYYG